MRRTRGIGNGFQGIRTRVGGEGNVGRFVWSTLSGGGDEGLSWVRQSGTSYGKGKERKDLLPKGGDL